MTMVTDMWRTCAMQFGSERAVEVAGRQHLHASEYYELLSRGECTS